MSTTFREKHLCDRPPPRLAFGKIDRLGSAQQLKKPPARDLVLTIDDPERGKLWVRLVRKQSSDFYRALLIQLRDYMLAHRIR